MDESREQILTEMREVVQAQKDLLSLWTCGVALGDEHVAASDRVMAVLQKRFAQLVMLGSGELAGHA